MNKINKEDILSKKSYTHHSLNMKELRKFVEDNSQIDDYTPVMIQRVEDTYFEGMTFKGKKQDGLSVYLREGDIVGQINSYNSKKEDENLHLEVTEDMMDQFYSPHCISKEPDDSLILIYSHY